MAAGVPLGARLYRHAHWIVIAAFLVLPVADAFLPEAWRVASLMRPIFIFAILGLGLNIVTGYTGLLHLGVAAFMAIGAYAYGILTCDIYPFQLGFWKAVLIIPAFGAIAGAVLGLPTLRLRGDYLAIVTLGFGEIMQDILRNLDTITKGTQSINPLPDPTFFGYTLGVENYVPWYYLLLGFLAVVVLLNHNLEHSRVGRAWVSIREDELASLLHGYRPHADQAPCVRDGRGGMQSLWSALGVLSRLDERAGQL
jgi:branched-chain amino acid transport system permease protein